MIYIKWLKYIFFITIIFSLWSCQQQIITNQPQKQIKHSEKEKALVKIAMFFPLTGLERALSLEYIKMIEMGLNDNSNHNFKINYYDCYDKVNFDDTVSKIKKYAPDILIGSTDPSYIRIITQENKDNPTIYFSLSNDPSIASDRIMVLGHAPIRQLLVLINFFITNKYKKYILLLPERYKYKNVLAILKHEIRNKGAKLEQIVFYNDDVVSINEAVELIAYNIPNIINEGDRRSPVIILSDDNQDVMQELIASITNYSLDEQAIISGDSSINVKAANQIDIIFAGLLDIESTNALSRMEAIGINYASQTHAVAYDLGKIIALSINDDYNISNFFSNLNKDITFFGISGEIRMIDCIAQRKYLIISKERGVYRSAYQ